MSIYYFRDQGIGYKGLVRKYKGCVGGVREICGVPSSGYFSVVGLDRYLGSIFCSPRVASPEPGLFFQSRFESPAPA